MDSPKTFEEWAQQNPWIPCELTPLVSEGYRAHLQNCWNAALDAAHRRFVQHLGEHFVVSDEENNFIGRILTEVRVSSEEEKR